MGGGGGGGGGDAYPTNNFHREGEGDEERAQGLSTQLEGREKEGF